MHRLFSRFNESFSCFTRTLIITVLVGFSVGTARAAIVPELTGTFYGSFPTGSGGGASFTMSQCTLNGDMAGVAFPEGGTVIVNGFQSPWDISNSQTSMTYSYGGDSINGFCRSDFSGTTDGPITGTYKSLTFKGAVTGGTYTGGPFIICQGGTCAGAISGEFSAPFTGFWSNGWESTGTLSSSECAGDTAFCSMGFSTFATLDITTTATPEPSTFMMLGAGLLPVIGVIRRRYLNR